MPITNTTTFNPYNSSAYMPEGMAYNPSMMDWNAFDSDYVNSTLQNTGMLPGIGTNQNYAQLVAGLPPFRNK